MTELRDAYHLACVEMEAATRALQAAETRFRAAQIRCEEIESALGMTKLSTCPFPELPKARFSVPDVSRTRPYLALVSLGRSSAVVLRRRPDWSAATAGLLIAMVLSVAYVSSLLWSDRRQEEASVNYAPLVGRGEAGGWASVASIFGEETAEGQ